jgi:hypothetical protein
VNKVQALLDWVFEENRVYWLIGGVVVGVALVVLFLPGMGESIEATVLSWVGGWAS